MLNEKMFPANVDVESELLVHLMAHPRKMGKAVLLVRPEHFYRNFHRDIFEAMLTLHEQERRCDVECVGDELQRRGKLTESFYSFQRAMERLIEGRITNLGTLEELTAIVVRKAKMRRLLEIGADIVQLAHDEVEDAVEQAEQMVCGLMMESDEKESSTLHDAIDRYMLSLIERTKNAKEGITPGLSAGFFCLDPIFKMLPGELCTIAALTGFGKSALALNIALHLLLQAERVMLFSLEMGESELIERLLSISSEVNQALLSSGRLEREQLETVKVHARRLRKCDMVINDQTYNVDDIVNKAKFEHARKPLKLIIVDYVQLMEGIAKGGSRENRATEVERVSRRLKQLAQTLQVPVLILSQVNREVEKRQSPEMFLSDLSDSSGVAKNSNRVAFIFCPVEEAKRRQAGQTFKVMFQVAKNRSGPIGTEVLSFAPCITKFRDESIPDAEEQVNGYV